jgi:hypothetical protein
MDYIRNAYKFQPENLKGKGHLEGLASERNIETDCEDTQHTRNGVDCIRLTEDVYHRIVLVKTVMNIEAA